MLNQNFKFKGGVWIGHISVTWPFGKLEIGQNELVISIDDLPFTSFKIERRFTPEDIEKIEVKRYLPIIGYGIHIIPRDKTKENPIYFWYLSFRFEKLINVLKELGWKIQ